jgi:NAD-dependent deacetylase
MKIVAFTGAGISKESGIDTFRDKGGLWDNYSIEEVADINGWKKDKQKVLDFYNLRRSELDKVEPNDAHKYLTKLSEIAELTIITQNVDDLHERSGAKNVLHLHGELRKMRSTINPNLIYEYKKDIKLGDKCEKGSQLRPHVVWFGEMPFNVEESYKALEDCDLLLIIGTTLSITYTLDMLEKVDYDKTSVIYIDPEPSDYLDGLTHVEYIKEPATIGLKKIYEGLVKDLAI